MFRKSSVKIQIKGKQTRVQMACLILVLVSMAVIPSGLRADAHPDDIYWDSAFGLPGAENRVLYVYIDGDDVYIGGWFAHVNNVPGTGGIARWDGAAWHSVGGGTSGSVSFITKHEGILYAGGSFSMAGGVYCDCIAWWDGAAWHAMGGGIDDLIYVPTVSGIVPFKGDIYVSGGFRKAGNKFTYGIARWDGSEWHDLDGGLSIPGDANCYSTAEGIVADDDYLYVVGRFLRAGDLEADGFVKWDGTQWVSTNSYLRGFVRSMVMAGSDIYIGGWFSIPAGTGTADNIARFDGNQWHPVGGGTNEEVMCLYPVGNDLFVSGRFSKAGGVTVNRIAKWNGTGWTSLGSGVESRGYNFAVAARADGELFTAGDFHIAGGTASMHIARWFNPVPYPAHPSPPHKAVNRSPDTQLSWDVSGPPNPPSNFDIHLGTTSEPPLIAQDHTGQSFDPGTLEYGTTYYWRIVSKDASGNFATGTVWRFTTEDEVTARLVVTPAAGHCRIAQDDTVTIDVLIADNPVPIDAGGVDISYDPGLLTYLSCEPGSLTTGWQHFEGADLGGSIRIGGYHTEAIPESSAGDFARLRFLSNCCLADSGQTAALIPFNLIDDLAVLDPIPGQFRCDSYEPDGDLNFDGLVTSGDALCAFQAYLSSPAPPPGSCGEPGWDVRADVDCSGTITPADALCIQEYWDDGSCVFCGPSSTTGILRSTASPPVVSLRSIQIEHQHLTVIISVANVTGLEAFGFELTYPADQLEYVATIRTPFSLEFTHLGGAPAGTGRLRQGGYSQQPVSTASPFDLVELRFNLLTPDLTGTITAENFVDDLAGADAVSDDLTGNDNSTPGIKQFTLYQNFPNPFNPGTEIRYEIPDGRVNVPVRLAIYDIEGKIVRTLVNTRQGEGAYRVRWNGINEQGETVASGIYFYVLTAGQVKLTNKLVRLK